MRSPFAFFRKKPPSPYELWTGMGGAVALALLAAFWILYANGFLSASGAFYLLDDDQARSALVAKSLATGLGYTTPLLTNAMIDFYHQAGKLNVTGLWENSDRFPLTIFGIFGLFKLLDTTHYFVGIALYGLLFFTASAAIIYRLAFEVLGRALPALLVVALMCVRPDIAETVYFKGADDIFYTSVALLTYFFWRDKIYSGSHWRALVLGVFIGLDFLCRENMGLFFCCGMAADALWAVYKREHTLVQIIRAGLATALGLILCILPWGIYTYRQWGRAFFSANSLYQFSFYTRHQMVTDSWWKLHTPVGSISNTKLFLSDPIPFLKNWGSFIFYNAFGFTASYAIEILAALYGIISRLHHKVFTPIRPLYIVLGTLAFLNLMTLGFFVGSVYAPEYFIYLIPVLFIFAIDGGLRFLERLKSALRREFKGTKLYAVFKRDIRTTLRSAPGSDYVVFVGGGFVGLILLIEIIMHVMAIHGLRAQVEALEAPAIKMAVPLVVVLALVTTWLCKIKLSDKQLWLSVTILTLSLIVPDINRKQYSTVALPQKTEALKIVQDITSADGIVLGFNGDYALPWLVNRPTLGLPEYPDYIYEMITKYNLPIETIYLDGAMSWYLDSYALNWAPSYQIYPILGRIRGVIPGFELVDCKAETDSNVKFGLPEFPKEVSIYHRISNFDFEKLIAPPQSYMAERPEDRIHFVSGFGETGTFDGKTVIFASNDTRARFEGVAADKRPWADSDITFHATEGQKPKTAVIEAYLLGPTHITAYFNLDLDVYDRERDRAQKVVGEIDIDGKGWQQLSIPLPASAVVSGLNKIGLRFNKMNSVKVCRLLDDAPATTSSQTTPEQCFRLSSDPLPSGILASAPENSPGYKAFGTGQKQILPDPWKNKVMFDPTEAASTVESASGSMLIHKVTFAY